MKRKQSDIVSEIDDYPEPGEISILEIMILLGGSPR